MAAETLEIARLVLIAVVFLGYVPIVIAHLRYGTKWVLSAYTALVTAAAALLLSTVIDLPYTGLFVRLAAATSAVLFMVAAHMSEQKIMSLADRAEKGRIPLDDGDTQ